MEEFNDKSQTMRFTPPHEEKQHIERTDDNIYSQARQSNEYYPPEKESSNRTLVYIALILSILLIIVVIAGVFILKMDN